MPRFSDDQLTAIVAVELATQTTLLATIAKCGRDADSSEAVAVRELLEQREDQMREILGLTDESGQVTQQTD